MDSDIIRPKKQEIDTTGLDAARDELMNAVEAGTIREGHAEDGLSSSASFESGEMSGEQFGATALSSATDADKDTETTILSGDDGDPNHYRAPIVDISSLPTERSRNQEINDEETHSNVRIAKSQSSRIRNIKLEKEAMTKTKHKKSPLRIIVTIVCVLIALFAVLAGVAIVWYSTQTQAVCADCTDFVAITINSGEGSEVIANRLEEKGVIKSALAFRIYVKLNGMAGD